MQVDLGTEVPPRCVTSRGRGRHLVRGDDMSEAICSVEGCERSVHCKGWCQAHYRRWKLYGDPLSVKTPRANPGPRPRQLADMPPVLALHSEQQGECLVWTGTRHPLGYGYVSMDGFPHRVHRIAWELANGPIPSGANVCHRCDNPPCFELSHLFLGTHAENAADKIRKGRARNRYSNATHCVHGHEFTPENTILDKKGYRSCRVCKNEWQRAARAKRRMS